MANVAINRGKEYSDIIPQMKSEQTQDLEELLLALRANAESEEKAGISVREHPSVSFYRGDRPVQVRIPPHEANATPEMVDSLRVIALHQALLPLSQSALFTEEEESRRIAGSDGLELLRFNWELLLWLLIPSVQPDSSYSLMTEGTVEEEHGEKESMKGPFEGCDSTPIQSLLDVRHPLKWRDYTQLRQPSIMDRVHYSYVVFLRFYGWRLHEEERGILDRHQNWRTRYSLLSRCCCGGNGSAVDGHGDVCRLTECFYNALTRIIRVLCELCLSRYAVNLVAFLLEEISKDRLLFLQRSVEREWLPLILCSKQVAEFEKERLRRQLHRITHSDSD